MPSNILNTLLPIIISTYYFKVVEKTPSSEKVASPCLLWTVPSYLGLCFPRFLDLVTQCSRTYSHCVKTTHSPRRPLVLTRSGRPVAPLASCTAPGPGGSRPFQASHSEGPARFQVSLPKSRQHKILAGTGPSWSVFSQSKQDYDDPPKYGPSWPPRRFSHTSLTGTLEVAKHLFFAPPQRGED